MSFKCVKRLPRLLTGLLAILLLSCYSRANFDSLDCGDEEDGGGGSGSTEGERDWWVENITNGTELCSGVIDVNSSLLIHSAKNTTHCELCLKE